VPELLEQLRQVLADRYRIERELGSGGMGTVYQVYDATRQERVALKTLHWADPAAIYRFKREFRALVDVSHRNLVQLHELVALGDVWFFTMELIVGDDFIQHVRPGSGRNAGGGDAADSETAAGAAFGGGKRHLPAAQAGGVLDLRRLRAALQELIRGVAALHAAQIVHRDLKPGNVLVGADGRVVILDFGIAADVVPSAALRTVEDGLLGTIEYMSPEHCAGERCTPASDWYSVGALLYEALTGGLPFTGSILKQLADKLKGEPPRPDTLVAGLPADLVELCAALMARCPADRPTDQKLCARLRLTEPPVVVDEHGRQVEGAPLVGRGPHLEQLYDALAAAERGQPVSVCVYGPSGIGKTTLVRHFTDELAADQRATVLAGRCFVRETVPYKALDGAIDMLSRLLRSMPRDVVEAGLPPDTTALARVFPVLRRVEAVERRASVALEISDQRELRRRAFAALQDILGAIAQQRPVVLHIDDLQWADRDSADLLNHLLRTAVPGRLLFVLCFRSEDVPGTPFLEELLAQADTGARRAVEIGPLSTGDAVEYAMHMLEALRTDAPARAQELARESDGNPFLLDQMVRVTIEAARGGAGDGRSLGLEEMLAVRLSQMPHGARELVEVLAVAGQPVNARVAYHSADLEGDERPLVASLCLAHLARVGGTTEQVYLYHDRIRESVVRELSADRTRAIHRRLAEELEASGGVRPESLYEHCLGAGDDRRAAVLAARAAADAQGALAFERAAHFYQRALDLRSDPGPLAASWLVGLGDALASAGRGGEAARAYLDAKPMLDPPSALEMERRAGQQYLISGRIDEGLEVISRVLAKVGLPQLATSPRRALLALLLRRVRIALRGLAYTERAASAIPPDALTRIDTCWAVAEGMATVDNIQGAAFQSLHLLLALDAGEPHRVGRALAMEAGFAASTGAAGRSARLLRDAEALAARLGSRTTLGLCRMMGEVAALHAGRFAECERLALEAEAILTEQQGPSAWSLNIARLYHVGGIIEQGKIRELGRLSRVFLEDAVDRGNRFAATMFRSSWSMLRWLGADDLTGARVALEEVGRQCPDGVFYVPHTYCLVAQALVDLYAGAARDAYDHVTRVWPALERSQVLRVQALADLCFRMRATCAIAAARGAADPRPLLAVAEHDVRRLRRLGRSFPASRGWPEMLEAAIAVARGRSREAIDLLGRAMDGFRNRGSLFYLAVATRKKGELLGGDEGRALMAEADAWMTAEGIVNPARLAATFVPAFAASGAP
jgi:serine/threonine protein kinase